MAVPHAVRHHGGGALTCARWKRHSPAPPHPGDAGCGSRGQHLPTARPPAVSAGPARRGLFGAACSL